jgi:NAD(P)-dependent dehydrogenase (short-subunit alcohol dehydrogenase family)
MNARPAALITGASRGIGAATAVALAGAGWDVMITYVSNDAAAKEVADACRALGAKCEALQADVSVEADVLRVFEAFDREFGSIGALINNAGVVDRKTRVDELTVERINRMFAINVTGTIICAREAVRRMSTLHGGNGGIIVNVGSAASRLGGSGEYVDYAASKGAVDTFTIGLAKEVATEGIRVNCVRPGIVDTDIHASGGQPDRAQKMAAMIPMQRPGRVDEIAASIVFMCSPGSSFMTGSFLDVSGGR